jgi:hypothetical protein
VNRQPHSVIPAAFSAVLIAALLLAAVSATAAPTAPGSNGPQARDQKPHRGGHGSRGKRCHSRPASLRKDCQGRRGHAAAGKPKRDKPPAVGVEPGPPAIDLPPPVGADPSSPNDPGPTDPAAEPEPPADPAVELEPEAPIDPEPAPELPPESPEAAPEEEPEPPAPIQSATAGSSPLRWAPPVLVEPKTIKLGTGYTHTVLATNRDYILKLPATKKVGGTWIDGGRNVVVIGGHVTIPAVTTRSGSERTAISIKGATGTVHVEGVQIDGSGGGQFDGITINAPQAVVQLQNLRVVGVRGGLNSLHADVVQPWGGVRALRIDRLTASTNYQGLTLQPDLGPIGSVELDHVDLTSVLDATTEKGGHVMWMAKGTKSCIAASTSLSNVFVKPRPGRSLGTSVWPSATSGLPCAATGTSVVGWPGLPVRGGVNLGPPPGGEFVPAGSVGIGYGSPGYLTS